MRLLTSIIPKSALGIYFFIGFDIEEKIPQRISNFCFKLLFPQYIRHPIRNLTSIRYHTTMEELQGQNILQVNINASKFNHWISTAVRQINENRVRIQNFTNSLLCINDRFLENNAHLVLEIDSIKNIISGIRSDQFSFEQKYSQQIQSKFLRVDQQLIDLSVNMQQQKLSNHRDFQEKNRQITDNLDVFLKQYQKQKKSLEAKVIINTQNIQGIEKSIFQSQSQRNLSQNGSIETKGLNFKNNGQPVRGNYSCKTTFNLCREKLELAKTAEKSKTKNRKLKKTTFLFQQKQPQTDCVYLKSSASKSGQPSERVLYPSKPSEIKPSEQFGNDLPKKGISNICEEGARRANISHYNAYSKQILINSVSQDMLNKKVKQIQEFLANELKNEKERIEILMNKNITLEEKLSIFVKKTQRQLSIISDLKAAIRNLQQTRADQRVIQGFKDIVSKNVITYQRMIASRVGKQTYESQKQKLLDKLLITQQNIACKAQKHEVRKAIIFLQDKIKEIIILITKHQGQEVQGAMTKLPLKCLSCDKNFKGLISAGNQRQQKHRIMLPARCQSSHIRRRTRNGKANFSLDNFHE